MSKKKKLAKINKTASGKILEIKAVLDALSDMDQCCYPANVLLEIAKKELTNVFYSVEKNRKILKIAD